MRPIVTLITDFGTADGYVGEMKGVLYSLAPDVDVVDITHDIPPQDVQTARLTLVRVWRRFPRGTVHLVVVDPGVGSGRRALALSSDGRYLVGPDNGVLSPALLAADALVIQLPVDAHASATFHGRDVFAPAAAALARGVPIEDLGVAAQTALIRRTPEPTISADGVIEGEVIAVDRFGNAITNIIALHDGSIVIGTVRAALRRTYADAEVGAVLAVVGSTGFVEIAVRDGSAARLLGIRRGEPVTFRPG